MILPPSIGIKLYHDRHREMRTEVGWHRLARQLRALARASRHTGEIPHRQRPAPGTVAAAGSDRAQA